MGTFGKDLRQALRGLGRRPAFTALVVLTLGLGIAVNSVVFSGVNALLLDPLPYAGADRLVLLHEATDQIPELSVSVPNFRDWRAHNRSLADFGGFLPASFNLTGGEEPERVEGAWISAASLAAFGVRPAAGRLFGAAEDRPEGDRVVVVRQSLWQRRWGDAALGEQWLTLDDESYRVIGVLPPRLPFPGDGTELWVPLGQVLDRLPQDRGHHPGLYALGRLPDGVSPATVRTEMATLARRLAEEYPAANAHSRIRLVTLRERAVGEARPFLLLLLAAVLMVLLIACFNAVSLLLARAAERRKEVALRGALGAGRLALVRLPLVESALLGLFGGTLGLLLAHWGLRLLVAGLPADLPVRERLGIDGAVLAFTTLVALAAGLACGLAPALETSRTDLRGALAEGGGRAGGLSRRWVRNLLVSLQLTATLALLTGAGLAMRSMVRMAGADPGFDAGGVLTLRLAPPESRYRDLRRWEQLFTRLLERVSTLPGVEEAGIGSGLPWIGPGRRTWVRAEDSPPPEGENGPLALYQVASPGYFSSLRLEPVAGRLPGAEDREDATPVVVVDDELAERLWPGRRAVGKRLSFEVADGPRWREVVGVVRRVPFSPPWDPSPPALYVPHTQPPLWYQAGRPPMTLVVRSAADPLGLAAAVRREVWSLDADQPVYRVATLESLIDEELLGRRLTARLMAVFALLALVLALVGVYGLLSHAVTQRHRELGVRLALGARPGQVLRLVLRQSLVLIAAGLGLGLLASLAIGEALAGVLYGVTGAEPALLAGLLLLLGGAALLASYFPARRATRTDPIRALRSE